MTDTPPPSKRRPRVATPAPAPAEAAPKRRARAATAGSAPAEAAPPTRRTKAAAPAAAPLPDAAPTGRRRTAPAPAPPPPPAGPLPSRYSPAEAEALFARLADALPDPKTELEYRNPFTLLVAVVLSAQATDAGVNKATRALFDVADTPETMAALGEDAIREHIKTLGFLNMKAKNVAALSRALVEQHGGQVPHDREALQALPGVGRKTANVVLNVAFGEPTIAVDTHIFRLGNRLGLAPGRTPDEVEAGLEAIVPKRFLINAHHYLILHGRHVCKARRPLCEACAIYELCKAEERRPLPHAPLAP